MTTNGYDHDEPTAIFTADRPVSAETLEAIRSATAPAAPPARLQAMSLPNGKFLLVLDGWTGGELRSTETSLRDQSGAASALVFRERVDVHSWPTEEFGVAAAEACAMTHGEDDAALIGAVRGMYAAQAAQAESWRLSGAEAVERVGVLEAEAFRLRAILDEVGAMAGDNRHLPVCSQIYDAASRVGRAA